MVDVYAELEARARQIVEETQCPVVLWSELFPTADDEPDEVRSGNMKAGAFLQEFAKQHFAYKTRKTLVVKSTDKAAPSGPRGCEDSFVLARDYLIDQAPRQKRVIVYMPGELGVMDAPQLSRGALGLSKKAHPFEVLARAYPNNFGLGTTCIVLEED